MTVFQACYGGFAYLMLVLAPKAVGAQSSRLTTIILSGGMQPAAAERSSNLSLSSLSAPVAARDE